MLASGCGAAPSASPARAPGPSAAPPPAPPSTESFPGLDARIESKVQRARLTLPDRAGWRGAEQGSFFVAEHPGTRSTLRLRVWRAPRLVHPDDCRAEARLREPGIIELGADEIVERRSLEHPPAFTGEIVVGVRENGPALDGQVQAFGAAVGACLAVVFQTKVVGAQRDQELGRRLSAFVDALGTLELLEVEGRVER